MKEEKEKEQELIRTESNDYEIDNEEGKRFFQACFPSKPKPAAAANTGVFVKGRPAPVSSDGLGGYFTHQGFRYSGVFFQSVSWRSS